MKKLNQKIISYLFDNEEQEAIKLFLLVEKVAIISLLATLLIRGLL